MRLCGGGAAPPRGRLSFCARRRAGGGRLRYVPTELVAAVRARLRRGEQVQAVLAEISAINAELLVRRELE